MIPRVAIIGLGGFGMAHFRDLSTLAEEGLCRVVAGCSPDPVVARHEWPHHFRLYRTVEAMLDAEPYDYVVVASPPHLHEEHAFQALDRGAFVYLEKPPTPTLEQLTALLRHPRANQVAVGFQMSESPTLTALKRRLMAGELGKLEGVLASALWPRNTSYYERADWAGKMHLADRPVVDGPLTNALSHIVQNMFFLVGEDESSCAVPTSVSGYFARARPIESYDFAWIKGTLEGGIEFDILGGHCSDHLDPWKISLRTDRGIYSVGEADMPDTRELLLASHRSALAARGGRRGPTTGLADCCGYSVATTVGLASSSAVRTIPSSEIAIFGAASDAVYHVETLHQLVCRGAMTGEVSAAEVSWIDFGEPIGCANPLSDVELALSDEALHP